MLLQIVAFKTHVILYKYVIEKVLALCYTQYTRYTHFFKKMSTRIVLKNSVNIGTAETQSTVLWTVYLMPCAPFEGTLRATLLVRLTTLQIRREKMKKNAAPSELRIRGCDSAVIAKLDELAAERGITRTLLAREILENYVYKSFDNPEVSKYEALTKVTLQTIKQFDSDLQDIRHGIEILLQKN